MQLCSTIYTYTLLEELVLGSVVSSLSSSASCNTAELSGNGGVGVSGTSIHPPHNCVIIDIIHVEISSSLKKQDIFHLQKFRCTGHISCLISHYLHED
jgi:hypothetical protein